VEEGLLFDGIELQRADVTPGDFECAFLIKSDTANAGVTGSNQTAVTASEATKFLVGQLFVQLAFTGPAMKCILEGSGF
jgi:hypothetical protein